MRAMKVFYCYARKDKALRDELEKHLEPLRRSGQITVWYDREIQPGMEWKREIDKHLNASDIFLLLISPNFMRSDYCYGVEMRRALERHETGEARVVPIILRPVDWKSTPVGELQVLPAEGKPIITWRRRDEAFQDVAKGIGNLVRVLPPQKTRDQLLLEGYVHNRARHYQEALAAYDQVLRLDPNNATAYAGKADALIGMRHDDEPSYEQELVTFEQALRLDPNNVNVYRRKTHALVSLGHIDEALAVIESAIQLNPNKGDFHEIKGNVLLWELQNYEQALVAYDQALRLDPNNASAYAGKAHTFIFLNRPDEALTAIEQATQLDPSIGYSGAEGIILKMLGRVDDLEFGV